MSRPVCAVLFPLLLAAQAGAANLFVDVSGSGTACTQSSPCPLATALAQMAGGDTVYVAGGTYTGTGSQVVLLDRGLTYTLQGGWDGAGGGAVVVDPGANETILDGQNARRVITITTGYPTIRGFTIRRGNASGLTVPCVNFIGNAAGCGGGVFAINSIPTIEDNVIEDNVASVAPPVAKVGVGGGIAILTNWPTIRGNVIRRNVAATGGAGRGGGIALRHCVGTSLVQDNEISDNTASDADIGVGGGALIEYGTVAVADNLFEGNVATSADASAPGAGLFASSGYCAARRNHFVGNRGDNTVFYQNFSGAVFEANRVVGNHTPIAVRFSTPGTTEAASIVNNFISDGGSVNLLLEGSTPNPLVATAVHNTVVGDGSSSGIKAQGTVDASLRNNIVARHETGIDPPETGVLTVDGTLFWQNDDDGVRGAGAVDGNPNFVDPLMRDFHLRLGSSAVNAGVPAAGIIWDIDGNARPSPGTAHDIGAAEQPPTRLDFGTPASPVAPGYTRVTEASRYEWFTGWGWATGTQASRSRGAGTALTRDFNMTTAAIFSIDLPPGVYDVTATFGDASYAHDQMQVSLEGVVVDTISTAKGEFVTRTWRTKLDADGSLDVLLKDLGAADPNVVINVLEVRDPTIVKVDFGTAGSPVAPSYARATHATTYSDALRFGWVAGAIASRDRGTADPLKRDFCLTGNGTFRLGLLPNGTYEVFVTAGDALYAHDSMDIQVGGSFARTSTSAGEFKDLQYWIGGSGTVGFDLDVRLTDGGGSDANVVINAVQTERRAQKYFDFGTATSPLGADYLRVTPAARFRPSLGYGWLEGTIDARDRGTGNPVKRDLNFTREGTFVVAVPNGTYWVSVQLGDTAHAHDLMKVTVEGTEIGTLTTAAGEVLEAFTPQGVAVEDGELTVVFEDVGGTDAFVAVVSLTVER